MVELKEIADVTLGYTFRKAIVHMPDEDVRVIQMNDVKKDVTIEWDTLTRTKLPGKKEAAWLEDGDIIFVARGYNNIAMQLINVPDKCVCSPHFFVIKVHKHDVDPGFIAWQINQLPVQQWFDVIAAGAAQRSIPLEEIRKLQLKILPIEEQRKIVELDRSCVREKQLYIELIKNREQTLFSLSQSILSED